MATRSSKRDVALYNAEYAAAAARQKGSVKAFSGFKTISFRGGVMKVDDTPIKGNALDCIVLANVPTNMWYEGTYDANNPQSPDCYAYGDPEDPDWEESMAPHEKARNPQADKCAECPHNEWGSAKTGRGKACQNTQRIALVTPDALESEDALNEADVRQAKISVTNTQAFNKLVNHVTDPDGMNRPTWGVVTNISCEPDSKTTFKLFFEFKELVSVGQDVFKALKQKVVDVTKELLLPQPDIVAEVQSGRGGKRNGREREEEAPQRSRRTARAEPERAKPVARKALRQPAGRGGR